jgi:hypothetical protein
MLFLETRSGLLAANAIVLIGGLCVRPTGNYFEIDYNHGQEARSTIASEEDVQDFLDEGLT